MIKTIIAPVQTWLLNQKRCVGCGMPLNKGIKQKGKDKTKVTCKCNRVYILDLKTKAYRRAKINEA